MQRLFMSTAVLLVCSLFATALPAFAQEPQLKTSPNRGMGVIGAGLSTPAPMLAGEKDGLGVAVIASLLGTAHLGRGAQAGFRLEVGFGGLSQAVTLSTNLGPVLGFWAGDPTWKFRPFMMAGLEYAYAGESGRCSDSEHDTCIADNSDDGPRRVALHGAAASLSLGFTVGRWAMEARYAPTWWFAGKYADPAQASPHRVLLTAGFSFGS